MKKKQRKIREWEVLLFEIVGLVSSICLLMIGWPMIISLIRGMAKDGVTAAGVFNTAVVSAGVLIATCGGFFGIRNITGRINMKRAERAEKKKKTLI